MPRINNYDNSCKELPNYITHLKTHTKSNSLLLSLPKKLIELTWMLEEELPPLLPPNLKYLNIGIYFDEPLPPLPDSLTGLTFHPSGEYNQPIQKFPPKSPSSLFTI